jgi:hypothetical protein
MADFLYLVRGLTFSNFPSGKNSPSMSWLFRQIPCTRGMARTLFLAFSLLLVPVMSFGWSDVPSLNSPNKVTSDNTTLTGFPKYIAQGQQTKDSTTDIIDAMYGTAGNHSPAFDFLMHYDYSGTGYVPNNMPPNNPVHFNNTLSTVSMAAYLQQKQNSQCLPMMTVYTANSSGGFSEIASVVKNAQCCALNLACLGTIAYLIHNGYGHEEAQPINEPISGLIVLNPDLLAADILISKGYAAIGTIEVNRIMALLDYMFNEHKAKYAIGKVWWPKEETLYTPVDTVLNVIDWLYASDKNCHPYNRAKTVGNIIETAFLACSSIYKQKLDDTGDLVPTVLDTISFTDDFPGWILANNYMVNRYGPSVAFAWDYGVYQYGYDGVTWIHEDVPDAVNRRVHATVDYYANHLKSSLFNPKCSSDFIASDIANYNPMQFTANFDAGWLFNQTSWNLWFYYLEKLSASLNSVPVLPYQVSGGGLPPVSNITLPAGIIGEANICNTLTNYIFGNLGQAGVLIPSDFDTVTLGLDYKYYSGYTLKDYLSSNIDISTKKADTADWNTSHLSSAYKSGICGICWGGSAGSAQLPGLSPFFPKSPGGRLADAVKAYRASAAPFPKGAYDYDATPAHR